MAPTMTQPLLAAEQSRDDLADRPERRQSLDLAQERQPGVQLGVLSRRSPGPLISADPHAATIVRVGAAHTGNNHG